jgi:hypothetical protein
LVWLGGLEGIRNYRAAVDADLQRGGPGDYLPVGVPLLAALGILVGAFLAALGQIVWGLARRSRRMDAKLD